MVPGGIFGAFPGWKSGPIGWPNYKPMEAVTPPLGGCDLNCGSPDLGNRDPCRPNPEALERILGLEGRCGFWGEPRRGVKNLY